MPERWFMDTIEWPWPPRWGELWLRRAIVPGTTCLELSARVRRHDVLFVPATGEMIRVDAVVGRVASCTRGIGGCAVAASRGAEVLVVGSAGA